MKRTAAVGIVVLAAVALAACTPGSAASHAPSEEGSSVTAVVPLPASQKADASAKPFTLGTSSTVRTEATDAEATARLAVQLLGAATGLRLQTASGAGSAHDVVLRIAAGASPESYTLQASAAGVTITGADEAGLFYGVQTLTQLLRERDGTWQAEATEISDHPRFAYRGAMLDVARHFFPVDVVKHYIDDASSLKLNVLHLHLTDDQGWRIRIDSRPKLTERASTTSMSGDPGGFYTKADFADIVAYAASRHMTVVPEIDLPGHTHAVGLAYPELAEAPVITDEMKKFNQQIPVAGEPYTGDAVGFSSLKIHDEATYTFVEDVVRELAVMTPGPYIHIGGDEPHSIAPADYRLFVDRVTKIVADAGKTPVAWHEAGASTGIAPSTVGQYWGFRTPTDGMDDQARTFVENGAKVVMSPADAAYLDMKYDASTALGLTWANGPTSVERSYSWEPTKIVDGIGEQSILGVEAPLWSETLRTADDIDEMAFPRLASAAEIAWSPAPAAHSSAESAPDAERTWSGFRARVGQLGPLWTREGIHFFASPEIDWAAR
ncbi:beta-N-acetylhexosaminidase [Microbacterium rhizosphaerae]|uniref:beta-N-acetylhexosaminidase n=1 Tax=Microbacterium rhizosphaerae TaxID=1678237 RepID=A0ABZ0SMR8_9MICO|nr:beta-N-acetylhexosaminidase [Microbacterium rhizosphaerae]WPR90672.1 beta-N-acetylhexosaminidase [Microbacterium rhizosphaerae]